MPRSLRPYQEDAIGDVREAFREGARAPLLVLPTGGGKTVIFSEIAQAADARGRAVLILNHRRELIRQSSAKLHDAGVPHGIIAPGSRTTYERVQIASVQTLAGRLDGTAGAAFDLIIVDEAHHAVAGQWAAVLAAYPRARVLGVTATPERLDGRGLGVSAGGIFDRLVLGPSVKTLTAGRYLVAARIFAPSTQPDLAGVRRAGGEYAPGSLAAAMDKPGITGDAAAHYARLGRGAPAVAFCASIAHAESVARDFRAAGWRAVAVSGATGAAERDAAIGGLATGAVQVLTTCDLISEGLDVPAIGVVILLRPTQSRGLHLQQVGRGLRPAEGKDGLLVLDHAGNTMRFGLPDHDHEWSLDGRAGKPRAPVDAIQQCPACLCIHRPAPTCEACGHVYEVARAAAKRDGPKVRAGELVEVDAAQAEALRTRPLAELIAEARGLTGLREIAKARGFSPRWATHQYGKAIRGGRRG